MATKHPADIDGYDWDISEEPPTYSLREREDACNRATEWRRSQISRQLGQDTDWEFVTPAATRDQGWVHIGNIIEWDKSKLRIIWHPETDDVQLEGLHLPIAIELPDVVPRPPEPISFSVTFKRTIGNPDVWVRLRFLPSRGREDLVFPVVSMRLPPPAEVKPILWEWTTRLAESRLNVIKMAGEFLDTQSAHRLPMYQQAIYDLLHQIGGNRGRRHQEWELG